MGIIIGLIQGVRIRIICIIGIICIIIRVSIGIILSIDRGYMR